MKTELFDYDLPAEFIAQRPPQRRDRSKLFILRRADGSMQHRTFSDLQEFLGRGDVLVLNDTRVIRARLHGRRATGGAVDVLILRKALSSRPADTETWATMLQCRGRLRDGETIAFDDAVSATVRGRDEHGNTLLDFPRGLERQLDHIGRAPLPPYIRRDRRGDPRDPEDLERYQTVYARVPGAVAAPTAGLHFTPELLDRARAANCGVVSLTLHVGPGTFKPVKADNVEDHVVDAEPYAVSADAADAVNHADRVIAVGTTTCRALEALGREGAGRIRATEGATGLFIYPPFEFRVVDALVTNFHLPRSSLLMLVSAFATRELILAAYEEAKRRRYRFYSYGDAMLIL